MLKLDNYSVDAISYWTLNVRNCISPWISFPLFSQNMCSRARSHLDVDTPQDVNGGNIAEAFSRLPVGCWEYADCLFQGSKWAFWINCLQRLQPKTPKHHSLCCDSMPPSSQLYLSLPWSFATDNLQQGFQLQIQETRMSDFQTKRKNNTSQRDCACLQDKHFTAKLPQTK